MADLNEKAKEVEAKIDAAREKEAGIRKRVLAWVRQFDPAVWAGVAAGLLILFLIIRSFQGCKFSFPCRYQLIGLA